MQRPKLIAATLRDLTYLASRLRPEDEAEVSCQYDNWTPLTLAIACLRDHAYIVELNDNPEAALGAGRVHSGLWIAWSWGSTRMWRCVPTMTEFVRDVMIPDIIAKGGWRCEARAMASHIKAHRWLKRMGATERCLLPCWGKGGEDFILWDWTRPNVLPADATRQHGNCPSGNRIAGER
jgi:hypothetical protein